MSGGSASKRKGSRWESSVVVLLKALGFGKAERRALNGTQDRGDIAGVDDLVIECKDVAQLRLREWIGEAQIEATRDGARIGVVALKRTGNADPAQGYAVVNLEEFLVLWSEYLLFRSAYEREQRREET